MLSYYVQSAGHKPTQDYRWYRINHDGSLSPHEPNFLANAREWLDMESVSLLLWRDKNNIHLLLANLPTKHRVDYRGRSLRNYLAFDGTLEDEHILCALAADFLDNFDYVKNKVDNIVVNSPDSQAGFSVSGLITYINNNRTENKLDCRALSPRIAKLTTNNKINLAEELRKYAIPKHDVVVAVTSILDPETWEKTCPLLWRGLTDMEKSEHWIIRNTPIRKVVNPGYNIPGDLKNIINLIKKNIFTSLFLLMSSIFFIIILISYNNKRIYQEDSYKSKQEFRQEPEWGEHGTIHDSTVPHYLANPVDTVSSVKSETR